jgi:hypothetical protein
VGHFGLQGGAQMTFYWPSRKGFDRLEKDIPRKDQGEFMHRLLTVAILVISTSPLFAQAQPDPAKLKGDAQKIVGIIKVDKAKSLAYCQINSLGGEIDLAAKAKDEQKADVLTKKINDLEKRLGPEYIALFDALNNADQSSKDFQDILSMRHLAPHAGASHWSGVELDTVEIENLEVHNVAAVVLPLGAVNESLRGLSFLRRLRWFEYADNKLVLEQ